MPRIRDLVVFVLTQRRFLTLISVPYLVWSISRYLVISPHAHSDMASYKLRLHCLTAVITELNFFIMHVPALLQGYFRRLNCAMQATFDDNLPSDKLIARSNFRAEPPD